MTNPSNEYMRRIRREERAKLLGLRRERVVKALRSLDLHGGSHAMLSQIAYAIHPHVGAWDVESCDHLRRVLAELIGGARETVSGAERHCACGVSGCDRGDESEAVGDLSHNTNFMRQENEIGITDELREWAKKFEYTWINVVDGTITYTTADFAPDIDSIKVSDYIIGIADRIDEKFAEYQRAVEALALVHRGTLAAYKRLKEKLNE